MLVLSQQDGSLAIASTGALLDEVAAWVTISKDNVSLLVVRLIKSLFEDKPAAQIAFAEWLRKKEIPFKESVY